MFFQALLIGIWTWFVSTSFALSIGFAVLGRPFISGLVVGLILGDPVKGMMVGGTINLIYIGWISAGGSSPADMTLAGIIGTTAAITGNLTAEQALAVAVPVGLLGVYGNTFNMTVCSIFPHWADRYAEEGNMRGIALLNIWPRAILNLFERGLPAMLVALYGGNVVQGVINALPAGAIQGLNTAGAMLPSIGVGMLLTYMGRGKVLPFFFAGYLLAAYASKDLIYAGLLGAVLAFIYLGLTSSAKEAQA